MTAIPALDPAPLPWKPMLRRLGFGLGFWLAFLLMLEPGNLVRSARMGLAFDGSGEALRIACAALLGASVSPGVIWLSRRLPVRWPNPARNGALLFSCLVALALTLILVGAVISPRLPPNSIRGGLGEQVASNILLLTAALATMAAIVQIADRRAVARVAPAPRANVIAVKRRGETLLIDPSAIDWIESQGNYLALHVGPETHLVRGVLGGMVAQLDPGGFVRVHRGAIVNITRVRRLQMLANGDAWLDLDGGGRVRASRTYGQTLRDRLKP